MEKGLKTKTGKRALSAAVRSLLVCVFIFLTTIGCADNTGKIRNMAAIEQPEVPKLVINEVVTSNYRAQYDTYDLTSDWVEIRNLSGTPVRLKGYGLSDNTDKPFKFTFPDIVIPAGGYLVVRASGERKNNTGELHAPFKLKQAGDTVMLSSPLGSTIDWVKIPELPTNRSYGRTWTDPELWAVLSETSIGRPNTDAAGGFTVAPVKAGLPSGSFANGLSLVLSTDTPGAEIHYTLDGSTPDITSPVYSAPLPVTEALLPETTLTAVTDITEGYYPPSVGSDRAVIVRARAFAHGADPSEIFTGVYFLFDPVRKYTMPILNVTADPGDLMDPGTGIYVLGNVYREWRGKNPGAQYQGDSPANYNRRGDAWRIKATVDFMDGKEGFSVNAEMKMIGGWSRASPQKSFQLMFHSQNDTEEGLRYELFPGLRSRDGKGRTIDFFRSVILRNGGNDWPYTLFRDPMVHELLKEFTLDTQASRPCVVYLNGEYWGILNMREAHDEGYFLSHYGVPMDSLSVLEGKTLVGDGTPRIGTKEDNAAYSDLVNRIITANFTSKEVFEAFTNEIDFQNHALYTAVQIWIANLDWPGNNIRYWKYTGQPRENSAGSSERFDAFDGRYRWLLYDTEFSFNIYNPLTHQQNMFETITSKYGPVWPNPPWSTALFRVFMTNAEYKRLLVNACSDLMNTVFTSDSIRKAVITMEALYEREMDRHHQRWPDAAGGSMEGWKNRFESILTFAQNRNSVMNGHIRGFFPVKDPVSVSVTVHKGGTVRLNNLTLPAGTFNGTYYSGNAIDLTAVADPGWIFAGWQGSVDSAAPSIVQDPGTGLTVTAVFKKQ